MRTQSPPAAAMLPAHEAGFLTGYLEMLNLLERLHRLLLDVIKDEFERLDQRDLNPVQALLIFNIGEAEVSAGELKTRGYYQGSNVSYNLKRLVEMGYMHHERSEIDRRSVRIRLSERGRQVRDMMAQLFAAQAGTITETGVMDMDTIDRVTGSLRRVERFWSDRIRYIY